jgi:hypothetical protein
VVTPEVEDRRQWALTLVVAWTRNDDAQELHEVAREAMRAVGPDGLIVGLADLGRVLMRTITVNANVPMEELEWSLRRSAGEAGGP